MQTVALTRLLRSVGRVQLSLGLPCTLLRRVSEVRVQWGEKTSENNRKRTTTTWKNVTDGWVRGGSKCESTHPQPTLCLVYQTFPAISQTNSVIRLKNNWSTFFSSNIWSWLRCFSDFVYFWVRRNSWWHFTWNSSTCFKKLVVFCDATSLAPLELPALYAHCKSHYCFRLFCW